MSSMGQVECVAGSSAGGLIARGCAAVRPSHIMSPPHTHVLNPAARRIGHRYRLFRAAQRQWPRAATALWKFAVLTAMRSS